MSKLSLALSGLSLAMSSKQRSERNEIEESKDDSMSRTEELLEEQLAQKRRNEAPVGSVDATLGTFIKDIKPGETVVLEYEPKKGYELVVDEVFIDRRIDFEYRINLDGVVHETNQWNLTPPRHIHGGRGITIEIENNSGSTETVDVEVNAWAITERS